MQEQDYFTEKRIALMVETANKKVMGEIQLLKNTIVQLENEITDLRRKVNGNGMQMPKAEPVQKPVEQPAVEQPKPVEQKPAQQTEGQLRYGNYTPEDVSVDKFFYFGNKK